MNDDLDSLDSRIQTAKIELGKLYKDYEKQLADNPSDHEACRKLRKRIHKTEATIEYLEKK